MVMQSCQIVAHRVAALLRGLAAQIRHDNASKSADTWPKPEDRTAGCAQCFFFKSVVKNLVVLSFAFGFNRSSFHCTTTHSQRCAYNKNLAKTQANYDGIKEQ